MVRRRVALSFPPETSPPPPPPPNPHVSLGIYLVVAIVSFYQNDDSVVESLSLTHFSTCTFCCTCRLVDKSA
jgi:hypothetical protein